MKIIPSIKFFIKDSRATGAVLVGCTAVSLIASNVLPGTNYTGFWTNKFEYSFAPLHLPDSLLHAVNDVLMSVFFFFAGLEIKREVLTGELNTFKKSLMPVISAVGGMLLPAVIYLAWSHSRENFMGWGIPMATDIAFSLGVLSLLGKRAPLSMRIFLTAIAIIDDIGGILTIAVFYAGHLQWTYLALAAAATLILLGMNFFKIRSIYLYLLVGVCLWYFVYNSGVHATIAGVILAFAIPSTGIDSLERFLRVPVNFIILPLFALANTAIRFPTDLASAVTSPVCYGIFTGLVVGKPFGIFLATYIAAKSKIAEIPSNITMKQVFGIGLIAGIGFTVSIFITVLAFSDTGMQTTAKLAVIAASIFSGITGYYYLRLTRKKQYGTTAPVH